MTIRSALLAASLAFIGLSAPATAQEEGGASAADANNPLANFTAFNIQNYYIGSFTGLDDVDGNQLVFRYAKPFSIGNTDWLLRASLPVNTFPVGPGGSRETGLGDIDAFAAYQVPTGVPGLSFGIGPQIVAPSATVDGLGSDQWQLGLANVLFDGRSPKFQWGYLAIYRAGVGDTGTDPKVSLGAFQPIAFYQLGNGWYTGGAPIWTYNFRDDTFSVPMGLRLGKVFQGDGVVYNAFIEPQVSVWDRGVGQPEWQVYFALNMQFP